MNEIKKYLHDLHSKNQFCGSVLVAHKGNVICSYAEGYANFEHCVSNTSNTIFNIGSITKQFTATAILILCDRGLLNVNNKLLDYMPSLPAAWNQVSIIQLLTHTSGIADYVGLVDWNKQGKCVHQPLDIIKMLFNKPLDFVPGAKFNYCATGYVLLGMLIELVSKLDYVTFLKKNIFDVLTMNNTGVYQNDLVIPNRAYGYEKIGDTVVAEDYFDMSLAFASGNLYSNIEDLYLWNKALIAGKLLTEKSLNIIKTPTALNYEYGCALELTEFKGEKVIGHNGQIGSFSSIIKHHDNEDLNIIVLSNVEAETNRKMQVIAFELAELVLR